MRILGAAVVVLLLAGCAQQAPPVEPVETSTPTVELAETVAQPAQVFDGDCSAIFTDEALSAALGQQLTRPSPAFMANFGTELLEPESFLEEQAGGVDCAWAAPQQDPATFTGYVLTVTALPATAVTAAEATACAASDMSATGCPIDVTANGIRLSGLVTSDEPGANPLARVAAVEALFVASAAAAPAPLVQTPPVGEWHTPVDCSETAESVDWAALGGPDLEADESLGTDAYASAVQVDLRGGRVLYTCFLFNKTQNLTFSLLGGGAWMRDAVLAQDGATVVDVPGFDLVIERPEAGTIDVFDGVNWLHAEDGGDAEGAYPLLAALVDALDAAA